MPARKQLLFILLILLAAALLAETPVPPGAPPAVGKAELQQRISELTKEREQLLANVQAVSGAIQDCEYWLAQLDKPKPQAPTQQAAPKP